MIQLNQAFTAEVLVGPFVIQPGRRYPTGRGHDQIDLDHPAVHEALSRGLLHQVADEIEVTAPTMTYEAAGVKVPVEAPLPEQGISQEKTTPPVTRQGSRRTKANPTQTETTKNEND